MELIPGYARRGGIATSNVYNSGESKPERPGTPFR